MRKDKGKLGAVFSSMIILAVAGVTYSDDDIEPAEFCEFLEAALLNAQGTATGCQKAGDCDEVQDSIDFWTCAVAECWGIVMDDVDGVCSASTTG